MRIVRIARLALSMGACLLAGAGPRAEPAGADMSTATLERPLFSPNRRPPPPAATPAPPMPLASPAPPPPAAAPEVVLSGVILGGSGGVALLQRPQDTAPARITVGGQVDGWTVTEIHSRAVVLRHDLRSVTVTLTRQQP